jgi:competence protein ComEC
VWQQHAPLPWTVAAALMGALWLLAPRGFPARWIGGAGLLPMFLVLPPPISVGDLRIAVLDVGQGLAVVVQTRGHALLYDAGPAFGPQADSGNRIIVPYLRATGLRALDGMVVTHADADHSGGAASVLQSVPVEWLLSSLPDGHPLLAQGQTLRCEAGSGWQWDGIDFEVLHPAAASYVRTALRSNDRSCVLRIGTPGASVLLTADIEAKSERELIARSPDKLRAQVLLVPHHGSRTSSTPEFIAQVNADLALVTAGYRNRFGHPKDDVLERYRASGARIVRTDLDGALLLEITREGAVSLQRYRAMYRRYWLDSLREIEQ